MLTFNLTGNMLRTEDTCWQKCVTSTCFDGRVSWAEDRNGWDTFTLTYQEGNTAQQHGASNDTEIQVAQQPHSSEESFLTKCGEENLTGVGPEVGLQVGRLGVDLLAA